MSKGPLGAKNIGHIQLDGILGAMNISLTLFDSTFGDKNIGLTLFDGIFILILTQPNQPYKGSRAVSELRISSLPYTALSELKILALLYSTALSELRITAFLCPTALSELRISALLYNSFKKI